MEGPANFNTHSFSPQLAKAFGLKDAIFLQHIYYWLKHNKGKNKNFFDENWWTYNTQKGFAEYFEYLTPDDIRGITDRLKKKQIIITGNYNKSPYDRTVWYSLTEKGWELFNDKIREIPKSSGGNPESDGDSTKSNRDKDNSKGDKTKSKIDNSQNNTNSNTSLNNSNTIFSLDEIKKYFSDNNLKSDPEEFFDFYEEIGWKKGKNKITDRVATARRWEKNHAKMFPEKHKTTLNDGNSASITTQEPKEITDLRESFKSKLYDIGKSDAWRHFGDLQKIESGFKIIALSPKANDYKEILESLNIQLQLN